MVESFSYINIFSSYSSHTKTSTYFQLTYHFWPPLCHFHLEHVNSFSFILHDIYLLFFKFYFNDTERANSIQPWLYEPYRTTATFSIPSTFSISPFCKPKYVVSSKLNYTQAV